jgi:hypothetical protein
MPGVNIRMDLYKRAVLLKVDTKMSKVINEFYEKYLDEVEAKQAKRDE